MKEDNKPRGSKYETRVIRKILIPAIVYSLKKARPPNRRWLHTAATIMYFNQIREVLPRAAPELVSAVLGAHRNRLDDFDETLTASGRQGSEERLADFSAALKDYILRINELLRREEND